MSSEIPIMKVGERVYLTQDLADRTDLAGSISVVMSTEKDGFLSYSSNSKRLNFRYEWFIKWWIPVDYASKFKSIYINIKTC